MYPRVRPCSHIVGLASASAAGHRFGRRVNCLRSRRQASMGAERVERRLTAILAADVAGYSRLTGMDEEGTHLRLKEHLRVLITPKITEHRLSKIPATECWLSSTASSMQRDAPST